MKGKRTGTVLTKNQRKVLLAIYISETQDNILLGTRDLVKNLNLSYKIIYHTVGKLMNLGLLESVDKFTIYLLKVSEKGKQFLMTQNDRLPNNDWYVNSFLDRAHRITITHPLLVRGALPLGFKESVLSEKLNWDNPQLTLCVDTDKLTIRITPSSVVYHFNEVYGVNAAHVVSLCLSTSFRYTKLLFDAGWKVDLPHSAVVDQHHALSNTNLSKFTSKYDIHYLSDRLSFDKSVSPNEIELVHSTHSPDDFLKLTDFFEAIIRDEVRLSDLKRVLSHLCPCSNDTGLALDGEAPMRCPN